MTLGSGGASQAGRIASPVGNILSRSELFRSGARSILRAADISFQFTASDYAWKQIDRDSYNRYSQTVRAMAFTAAIYALGVPMPIAGGINGANGGRHQW